MFSNFDLTLKLLTLPGIIIGLVFHEYAHGYVADRLGDPTPAYSNRLTLNPLVHIDIFGFLMIMITGFGWAKPIPINPARFKGDRRLGLVLVSVAGCCANLIVAFTCWLILSLSIAKAGVVYSSINDIVYVINYSNNIWLAILFIAVQINLMLAVFNLVPIPPLDGSRIVAAYIPYKYMEWYYWLERYGMMILMLLIFFTGFFGYIISPVSEFLLVNINRVTSAIAGIIF